MTSVPLKKDSDHGVTSKIGKRPSTSIKTEFVSQLGPYDILCGRCYEANHNIGNRRFRVTIKMNLDGYEAIPTTSRGGRSKFIVSLVSTLRHDIGARFLKKEGSFYVEIGEKEARQKVGHALRDLSRMVQAQQESATVSERKISGAIAITKKKSKINRAANLEQDCIPDNCNSSNTECIPEPRITRSSEQDYNRWLSDWFPEQL
jgi:hypothetical protein